MSIERARPPDPFDFMPPRPELDVTSTDIVDGGDLPLAQGWDSGGVGGGNLSPHLEWSNPPAGTAGFAVTCFDPDAPTACGWWHWIVLGLSADCTSLATGAGAAGDESLPAGAFQVRNDYGSEGFGGAGPPVGDHPHRYIFTVYALDTDDLGLTADVTPAVASGTIAHHTLARGHITVQFSR